ncbi:MAG TPA: S41 family peptidase [Geobacteraceae bacterium]
MLGKKSKVILLFLVAALLAAGITIGVTKRPGVRAKDDREYLKMLKEVMTLVKKNYVEPVDDKKLVESAINGMLSSLDPHSAYMPPEPFKEMNIQIAGAFGGVGIELSMKDDRLTVVSPIQDTPAFRAGIRSGDHIARIDDKWTKGMKIEQAVKLMRGKEGTKVTLTIFREGIAKPFVFPLTRATIHLTSVQYRTLEPGYGYIKILQFQERSADDFTKALQTLKDQNKGSLKGLIVDLRYNPGGLVDVAVRIAGQFVGEGFRSDGTIVSTKGRERSANRTLYASVGEKEPHYPMVVLINGGSASASEILAGALQDQKRAVIMGTQSFGKGSVQSILPLKGGAGLKLTTARYYTPSGRSIQAKGITPDIIVGRVDLAAAKKQAELPVHEKDLVNHITDGTGVKDTKPEEKQAEPEKKGNNGKPAQEKSPDAKKPALTGDEEASKDYQLSRALELLKGVNLVQTFSSQPVPKQEK